MHTQVQKLNVNESDCEGRQDGQADRGENQWLNYPKSSKGARGERGARACNGGLGAVPQWGPVAKPLVRGSGGKAPWS